MRMPKTIGLSLVLLVASSTAMAEQTQPAQQQPAATAKAKPAAPGVKAKPANKATAATRAAGKRQNAGRKPVARSARHKADRRHRGPQRQIATGRIAGALPQADQYIGPMQVTGQREIGSAAWYGGRHLGRRTSSGEPLDAVRATAAHRTLPLHSLVRVTNLRNGRSVIVKVNDRGPVSRSLLIDVSPRAAEELDMMRAGIIKVAVEPVAPAGSGGSSPER